MIGPYVLYPLLWIPIAIAWCYKYKDTDRGAAIGTLLVIMVVTVGAVGMYDIGRWTTYEVPESEFYPIYIATCPFGIFTMTGEVSGVHFLFSGSISGEIDQSEKYVVKFMIDNRLKTVTLDANEATVFVDGSFEMEKVTLKEYRDSFGRNPKYQGRKRVVWKIHIPYLPEAPFEMTEDFIIP